MLPPWKAAKLAQNQPPSSCSLILTTRCCVCFNGVGQTQCEGQYGCCYEPASSSIGNGGASEGLPLCFKYNGGGSSYSFAPANGNSNSGACSFHWV